MKKSQFVILLVVIVLCAGGIFGYVKYRLDHQTTNESKEVNTDESKDSQSVSTNKNANEDYSGQLKYLREDFYSRNGVYPVTKVLKSDNKTYFVYCGDIFNGKEYNYINLVFDSEGNQLLNKSRIDAVIGFVAVLDGPSILDQNFTVQVDGWEYNTQIEFHDTYLIALSLRDDEFVKSRYTIINGVLTEEILNSYSWNQVATNLK